MALNQPRRTTFCSTLWLRLHRHGSHRYQLTNSSHPARGESSSLFALLHTRHSSPCFFFSPKLELKRTADHATLSAALKTLAPRFPGRHLAISLSLFPTPAFRHSDILRNPRFVFFLFVHSKRVSAAFSLPRARCLPSSLCCLPRIRGHASSPLLFFLLSMRFATSLTFVFRSFSSASPRIEREFSGPSRAVDPLSSNILALLLDASTIGTRAEDISPSTGIPAAVIKQGRGRVSLLKFEKQELYAAISKHHF